MFCRQFLREPLQFHKSLDNPGYIALSICHGLTECGVAYSTTFSEFSDVLVHLNWLVKCLARTSVSIVVSIFHNEDADRASHISLAHWAVNFIKLLKHAGKCVKLPRCQLMQSS